MASTNPYTSFTISQPFLGAPLQFEPALNSREFQELIDAYVTGSASRSDKISQVTLDFYKNATVDLNTGALVRTYNVFPSPWTGYTTFAQSPTQSLSSGCSPIYTPSPGSSATFGDSSYGSMSMTPPAPAQGARARVTKKAKKDTPKAAEARLPGFSIMTKDGIDVTNSAGRGTKTKEQREHAHLMRIMKACDACKKKKIRCDPSHRRSHEMSRTASTSTQQTSSSGPSGSTPPLSRATTHASSVPSFSPSNPIDDFVLFPEDDSWNADMDLGQFNFDINVDLGDQSINSGSLFDFSFDQQPLAQSNTFGYTPIMNDQYGLGQWAEPQGFQPTPNLGQLDANWQSGWLQAESLISPTTLNPLLSDGVDWSLLESTMIGSSPDSTGVATNNELSEASASDQPRRSRKRRAAEILEQSVDVSRNNMDIGILDPSDQQNSERLQYQAVSNSSAGSSSTSGDITQLQNAAQLVSKSLRRIKRAPAEYIALGEELQQLEGTVARLQQQAEMNLPASDMVTIRSLSAQLQVLLPSVDQAVGNGRRNKLSQSLRPHHARELEVAARRLSRSLCATINSVEAHDSTNTSTDNHPVLNSGRNLQLQVSPSVSRVERQTPDSGSSAQASDSTNRVRNIELSLGSEMVAPQVAQRGNGNIDYVAPALLMASRLGGQHVLPESIPSDFSAPGEEGSRPIERRLQSQQSRVDIVEAPVSRTSTADEGLRRTVASEVIRSSTNDLQEAQRSGGLTTSQPSRSIEAAPFFSADSTLRQEELESRPSATSTIATASDATRTQRLSLSHSSVNADATEVGQQSSTVLQTTAPPSVGKTQQNLAGALAILGSIALASNITSGLSLSAHLPYLIPLLALSLLLPEQHRTTPLTTALFAGAFLLTSSFTFPGIQDFRSTCTAWIGNDPFSATAKLALVATLISSDLLSSLNLPVLAVTAMNFLVGGIPDTCSSGTAVRVSRGQTSEDAREYGKGNYASWLGMIDMLSPVVAM